MTEYLKIFSIENNIFKNKGFFLFRTLNKHKTWYQVRKVTKSLAWIQKVEK